MDKIRYLFQNYGNKIHEDAPVSHLEHALQSAYIAEENGCPREVILASLLHDIGYLVVYSGENLNIKGPFMYEKIASNYLKDIGIGDNIPEMVEGHIEAKRWLSRDKNYFEKLSPVSKINLINQGGPLTRLESEKYLDHPLHSEFTHIRLFSDGAKTVGKKTNDLEYYLKML